MRVAAIKIWGHGPPAHGSSLCDLNHRAGRLARSVVRFVHIRRAPFAGSGNRGPRARTPRRTRCATASQGARLCSWDTASNFCIAHVDNWARHCLLGHLQQRSFIASPNTLAASFHLVSDHSWFCSVLVGYGKLSREYACAMNQRVNNGSKPFQPTCEDRFCLLFNSFQVFCHDLPSYV